MLVITLTTEDGVSISGPCHIRIISTDRHGRCRVAIEAPTTTEVIRDKAIYKQPRDRKGR